jgi:MFS family permease
MEPSESTSLHSSTSLNPTPYELYTKSWRDFKQAPTDLWLVFLIKFFHYHAYSAFVACLSMYLTDVKDLADYSISIAFICIGLGIIIASAFLGNFPDRFGVRICLIFGTLSNTLKFAFLALFSKSAIQFPTFVFFGAISTALASPSMESCVKHYTMEHYRTLAVACFASVAYFALLCSGIAIEVLLSVGSKNEDSFRIFFIYLTLVSGVAVIISFFVKDIDYNAFQDNPDATVSIIKESGWQHTREVIILKRFWRLVGVISMLVLIRVIFYDQQIFLPIYMDRDLNDDQNYGLTIIVNQLIVIILIPAFSYSQYFIGAYDSFIIAGMVATISPIFFLLGPSNFSVFAYIAISSIGEAILSSRFLEYIYTVAPKGKESVVLSLSYFPTIFSIVLAGVSTGILLEEYCPEDGDRKCWMVWTWSMVIASFGVIGLLLFRRWIEHREEEKNPYMACAKEAKKA